MKPNGVFFTQGTQASVVATDKFKSQSAINNASQSGPLLIDDGSINSQFNPRSTNRLIRSGVGVEGQSKVFFAISNEPVNFYDFALFFRDRLKCRSALYLDGVISVMYAEDVERKQTSGDFAAMFAVFENIQKN